MKKIIALALALTVVLCTAASCSKVKTPDKQETFDVTTREEVKVRMLLDDGRKMEFVLYPEAAPITVQNFVDLATAGFYDGLTFHRIVADFVVQSGDPKADGTGGSDVDIKGEFSANGVENPTKHKKGTISMARASSLSSDSAADEVDTMMDSASSQFFIVLKDSAGSSLDGKYAAFGDMTYGFDVLASLGTVSVDDNNKPYEDVVLNSIRVID